MAISVPEARPSGWREFHRWPPFTHGRIECKCGAEVAKCRCPEGCRTVGTVEWCSFCHPERAEENERSYAHTIHPPSETLQKHEQEQRLRRGYRSAAKILYPDVHISHTAGVQMCETGAFVEVHVWIPKEASEKAYRDPDCEKKGSDDPTLPHP